jgi:hypothetical protein
MTADDDEWRFGVDEVGESADEADGGGVGRGRGPADAASNAEGEGVLGSADQRQPDPEPGSPTVENAFFVVLGSLTMVAVIALLLL